MKKLLTVNQILFSQIYLIEKEKLGDNPKVTTTPVSNPQNAGKVLSLSTDL